MALAPLCKCASLVLPYTATVSSHAYANACHLASLRLLSAAQLWREYLENASISYIEYDGKCAKKWHKRIETLGRGERVFCAARVFLFTRLQQAEALEEWQRCVCSLQRPSHEVSPACFMSRKPLHWRSVRHRLLKPSCQRGGRTPI